MIKYPATLLLILTVISLSVGCSNDSEKSNAKSCNADLKNMLDGFSCVENPQTVQERDSCAGDKPYLILSELGVLWEVYDGKCPEGYVEIASERRTIGVPAATQFGNSQCVETNPQFITCNKQ